MFERIVVGVDGSDAALHAVEVASDIAKTYDSELHIVNAPRDDTVQYMFTADGAYAPLTSAVFDEQLEEAGQKVIDKAVALASDAGVRHVRGYVRRGDAAQQVLKIVDEAHADLVVTGRRGLGGMASLLIGSTSQTIAHSAKCACLTVN